MSIMGSHHRQVAILVPDDKLDCFDILTKKIGSAKTVQLFILDQYCPLWLIAPHCVVTRSAHLKSHIES